MSPVNLFKAAAEWDNEPGENEYFLSIQTNQLTFATRPANWPRRMLITKDGYESLEIAGNELKMMKGLQFMVPSSFEVDAVELTSDKYGEALRKTPHVVKSVKARDIEFRNPQTSADALQSSGEVFVQKSQMGGGSPVIRGFEANKVLIVVDGVRLNNAIYRGGHLQNAVTIDPNMLEKVEVLMGPGSVMYGSDALGGVMHFISKNPQLKTGEKPAVSGNLMLRSSSANFETTSHLDLNIGFKRIGFLSSVTFSDFGDMRSGANHPANYPDFGKRPFVAARILGRDSMVANRDVHLQQGAYQQWDILQKITYSSEKLPLFQTLNFQLSNSSDVPRSDRLGEVRGGVLRYADWYYGPQKRLMGTYRAFLGQVDGLSFFNQARLTLGAQDLEESRINRRFGNDTERSRIENVRVYTANLDLEREFSGDVKLDYGLEFTFNDVQSRAFTRDIVTGQIGTLDTRYPDGGSVMRTGAAYVSTKVPFARDKFLLTAGARMNSIYLRARFRDKSFFPFLQDELEQSYLVPSGSLGMVWLPDESWKISLLGATGFRAPNVDDVGKTFDSEPGSVIVPNPNVTAEYTYNGEFSLNKTFADRLQIGLSTWYTFYNNALVVRNFSVNGQDSIVFDGELSRVKAVVNAREANIRGVSATVKLRIAKGLELNHTSTLTRGNDISTDSIQPLDHISPFFGRTGLRYSRKRLSVEVYSIYNGWKRIEDFQLDGEDNEQYATPEGMPAWYTLNLLSSWTVNDHFRLQLGMENMLDRHYRYFASGISAPGRNLIFALRASF